MSASCLDYKTKRDQKKMDKKAAALYYKSQNTSIERGEEDDQVPSDSNKDIKLKEISSNERNNQVNQIHGYKVKIPFKEKKNLRSTLSLRQFNKSSSTFISNPTKTLNSGRKVWRKNK
mmetsp:Transcript_30025/g.26598  ORF Transcript_30025/g.26598 Transcript_30025/m.26598 type:complete len:118 (-) Transcript_30025:45-398(-)